MTAQGISTNGFILQEKPQIICAMIPGRLASQTYDALLAIP